MNELGSHHREPAGRSWLLGDLDTSWLGDDDTKADRTSSGSILDLGFLRDLNTASQCSSFFFIFLPARAFAITVQVSDCGPVLSISLPFYYKDFDLPKPSQCTDVRCRKCAVTLCSCENNIDFALEMKTLRNYSNASTRISTKSLIIHVVNYCSHNWNTHSTNWVNTVENRFSRYK